MLLLVPLPLEFRTTAREIRRAPVNKVSLFVFGRPASRPAAYHYYDDDYNHNHQLPSTVIVPQGVGESTAELRRGTKAG